MKKYICPMEGYLIDIKDIKLNKNMIVMCQNPHTKKYIKMYKGVVTFGNNLLVSNTVKKYRRWLEVNSNGDGFVICSKSRYEDTETINRSAPFKEAEILIDENLNSPDIYQFPKDDDAKLFIDLIREVNDDERH